MISYLPTFMPTKVLIIGGGGTGGRLVPLLAQFLKTCAWIPNPEITIVDDDVVEEKNLLRQNFIQQDVGKPKAQVLAQRYSRAFDIPIIPVIARVKPYIHKPSDYGKPDPKLVEQHKTQVEIFDKHKNNSIIVLCVDSPEARRHIIGNILTYSTGVANGGNILILDSGNENDFGQVTVSNSMTLNLGYSRRVVQSWGNTVPGDLVLPGIPINMSYYANMTAADNLSCADLDQTMAINCMMANTMFGIIQNFYYAKPISFHRLNVSLSHGITPEYMNPKFLTDVCMAGDYIRIPMSFSSDVQGTSITYKNFDEDVAKFDKQFVQPLKAATQKAELENKRKEAAATQAREAAIRKDAVDQAMAANGWTYPKAKEEQLPPASQLQKEILKDLEAHLKIDTGSTSATGTTAASTTTTATTTTSAGTRRRRTGVRASEFNADGLLEDLKITVE